MLFDPMTGEKGKAQTRIKDGKLQVYLQLQSGESVIIQTFDHPVETQAWKYIQEQPVSLSLDHDWTLRLYKVPPLSKELSLSIARLHGRKSTIQTQKSIWAQGYTVLRQFCLR